VLPRERAHRTPAVIHRLRQHASEAPEAVPSGRPYGAPLPHPALHV